MFTNIDKEFMEQAIELSLDGIQSKKGGPFGAIIVKDGNIVGKGYNKVTSTNDPTAHAEIIAIRDACTNLNTFDLQNCVIYTSCEPCPMCLSAIYWARITKIYYGANRSDAAKIGFDDDFIYTEVAKSLNERTIPSINILPEKANKVFEIWQNKIDKIKY